MTYKFTLCIELIALLLLLFLPGGNAQARSDWEEFKSAYLINGRIVDISQNCMSHSEGQGAGLLLAVVNDDRESFQQIWTWTQKNLQVRNDQLFAWSWTPTKGVQDINNASDGDLFIAWALSKAYTQWQEPSYLFEAIRISQSIRQKLLVQTDRGIVLLPGEFGFDSESGLKLNLSYWVFPAIDALAVLDPAPEWINLKSTGLQLIQDAQFGSWHLPPDWLLIKEGVIEPADGNRFGYDAVRIPLYLIWDKEANAVNIVPFQEFWNQFRGSPLLPAWVDLKNNSTATYNASLGFYSVAEMTTAFPQLNTTKPLPFDSSQGYYSSILYLFTQIALEDAKK
jgi:endoglucanase